MGPLGDVQYDQPLLALSAAFYLSVRQCGGLILVLVLPRFAVNGHIVPPIIRPIQYPLFILHLLLSASSRPVPDIIMTLLRTDDYLPRAGMLVSPLSACPSLCLSQRSKAD